MFLLVIAAATIASAPSSGGIATSGSGHAVRTVVSVDLHYRSSAVALTPDTSFDLLLSKARNGDTPALRALATIRVGSDGARAEAIDGTLSAALATNPAEVLRLIRAQPRLFRVSWLCEDRGIEPSRASVSRFNERAISALRAVHSSELQSLRNQCLLALRGRGH